MNAKLIGLFMFAAFSAWAQTNPVESGGVSTPAQPAIESQTNQPQAVVERVQKARAFCIQNRRLICGKILKIVPEGMVVDSGYTNLMRSPIDRSWIVPGTVTAAKAPNLVENDEPASVCVGLVFVTDTPKPRRLKPKVYDYVIIEGYPTGRYTYTSVGDVHKTVRKFSASLKMAIDSNLKAEDMRRISAAQSK